MESIYIQNLMKGQGSLELAMEILKPKERKLTIDDFLLIATSLILAYSTVVIYE